MVHNTQNYWKYGLCPSFGIICFPVFRIPGDVQRPAPLPSNSEIQYSHVSDFHGIYYMLLNRNKFTSLQNVQGILLSNVFEYSSLGKGLHSWELCTLSVSCPGRKMTAAQSSCWPSAAIVFLGVGSSRNQSSNFCSLQERLSLLIWGRICSSEQAPRLLLRNSAQACASALLA
jgi:hypothetical protein